jgi:hypothetical protein
MMQPSLGKVRAALEQVLKTPALFHLVNTRIILRTGVDLGAVKPGEEGEPQRVQKVLTALKDMGYTLSLE